MRREHQGGLIRAFVALEIGEGMRARIDETVSDLRRRVGGVRWVAKEAIHLTLRFLGPSAPDTLSRLEPELRRAAAACPPSDVQVSGLGLFPDGGSPRVLWLGLSLEPPVLALQAACEAAATALGHDREARPFRAHLTLGRWRDRAPRPNLPAVDLGTARLETLVLFRSDLRPQGAVYTPLATFPLGGG